MFGLLDLIIYRTGLGNNKEGSLVFLMKFSSMKDRIHFPNPVTSMKGDCSAFFLVPFLLSFSSLLQFVTGDVMAKIESLL